MALKSKKAPAVVRLGGGTTPGYVPATGSTMGTARSYSRLADAARYTAQAMSQGYFPNDVSGGLGSFLYRSWTPLAQNYASPSEAMTDLGYVPGKTKNMGYGWVTPPAPAESSGDGGYLMGGGGGAAGPVDVNWTTGSYTPTGQNVPSWWKAFVPSDKSLMERPDVAWSVLANAMIPYMSPEDQARIANQLYAVWGKGLESYAPSSVTGGTPWEDRDTAFMTGQAMPDTSYFMGTQRASDALATLNDLLSKEAGGDLNKLGSGYRWLQDVLGGITESGGSTRQNYMQMLSNVDPLLASAKSGDLAAFGPLGESLVKPYFTNFSLRPTTQAGTFGRERGSKFMWY